MFFCNVIGSMYIINLVVAVIWLTVSAFVSVLSADHFPRNASELYFLLIIAFIS